MDIENQEIKVRINNFNEKHFQKLGYSFNKNDYITIRAFELPEGSGLKILVECQYCYSKFKKSWRRYLETKESVCCNKCKKFKMMETSLEKYGNVCSIQTPEMQKSIKKKNVKNFGVENPFYSPEILKKCAETTYIKYGGKNTKRISKQQIKIHSYYGGILNHLVYPYYLDIFFEKQKIYFEYDGSGHDLSVQRGYKSRRDFNKEQKKRKKFLREFGLKEFRIISTSDILPDYYELLKIKKRAFKVLLKENNTWYYYNLDLKTESFGE